MTKTKRQEIDRWEAVLEKHGLGLVQPLTDHDDEGEIVTLPDAPVIEERHRRPNRGHRGSIPMLFPKMRHKVDANDAFMSAFGVKKVRTVEREIPEWTLIDTEVRRVLYTAFPKLDTNVNQRNSAGKWARIIYLYYRMRLPRQIVAKELRMNKVLLKRWIQKISFAEKGLNTVGVKRQRGISCHPSDTYRGNTEKGDDSI